MKSPRPDAGAKHQIRTFSSVKGPEYARLTGVVAVHPDDPGRTMSVTTAKTAEGTDGAVTRTAEITLDETTIAKLVSGGFVRWTAASNGSYTGNLILKPVYEYLPVTVHIAETDSDLGYLEYQDAAGSWVRMEAGQDYTFHMGDVPTFRTVPANASYKPSGIFYSKHRDSAAGEYFDSGSKAMGEYNTLELNAEAYYRLTPTFTQSSNNMTVRVRTEDVAKFDTARGLFAGAEVRTADGYTSYTVEKDILCNRIFALEAYPKDENAAAIWTVPGDSTPYSGQTFYHMSGPKVSDNILTLGVQSDASKNAWYSVSGAVFTQGLNLSTGHTTGELTPVEQAVLVAPHTGAVTGEDGSFTIPPVYLSGETRARYLVTYNGGATIQEVILPHAALPKTPVEYYELENDALVTRTRQAIAVTNQYPAVSGFSSSGAHFTSVSVEQNGVVTGVVDAIPMNNQQVTIRLGIDAGQPSRRAASSATSPMCARATSSLR